MFIFFNDLIDIIIINLIINMNRVFENDLRNVGGMQTITE